MRYFLVSYYQTPKGQMDEVVSVTRRLRTRDIQTCAVILDFHKQEVCQASLDGAVVPKDWQRIRDFYFQHYPEVINNLERLNGVAAPVLTTPVEDQSAYISNT
jgi:hypothetical protein